MCSSGRPHTLRLLLSCLLLAVATAAGAQVLSWRTHALSEYLPDARPDVVCQREGDFLWLGDAYGLIRYDGQRFDRLLYPGTEKPAEVTAIYRDARQRLWVGYRSGHIAYMDEGIDDALRPWHPEEGTPAAAITGFAEDGAGRLWLATYGEGLYCQRGRHLYNFDESDGLLGNDIYTLARDREGRIWAGTDGGINICSWHQGQKRVEAILRSEGLPDDIVRVILPDAEGNCWVAGHDGGFARISTADLCITAPSAPWTGGTIHALALTQGQSLWIGTEAQGLWRYDLATGRYDPQYPHPAAASANIRALHHDEEGQLWLLDQAGTLASAHTAFALLSPAPANIQALLEDRDGQLWAGTQEGLYQYRAAAGHFERVAQLGQLNVTSLLQDRFGVLWAGTFGDGVYCLDPHSRHTQHLDEGTDLPNGSILSMAAQGDTVWLATLGGVVAVYNGPHIMAGEKPAQRTFSRRDGLGSDFIYKVLADRSGRVWLGADGRAINLLQGGRITQLLPADSLPLRSAHTIAEDPAGHLWFGTLSDGIFRYDGQALRRVLAPEQMRHQSITGLLCDQQGQLLILHPNSIELLNTQTLQVSHYDRQLGVANPEIPLSAHCQTRDGRVWVGLQQGLVRYVPPLAARRRQPLPRLLRVTANAQHLPLDTAPSLSHDQNNIVFDYLGFWFSHPAGVRYRYMLEGFDADWIAVSEQRAVYSKLPPGAYTFWLSATENRGFSDEAVLAYRFVIRRPFWQRGWFVLLCVALVSGLVYTWIQRREQRAARDARLVREKVESQYEALKSQINPHFLFNSFNTLSAIIEDNPRAAVAYVEQLSDFYRSILQYREKETIALAEELELVRNYAFLLEQRYEAGFSLQVNISDGLLATAAVAPLALQMLVENAVKHNVISQRKPLRIEICDTPDGYLVVRNNRQAKLVPELSTGFGLQNIRSRYALLSPRPVRVLAGEAVFEVGLPLI